MLKLFFFVFFSLLAYSPSDAQSRIEKLEKKLGVRLCFSGGIGYSYFSYKDNNLSDHFSTPEFRFGFIANKKLVGNLFIKSGLQYGVKVKRKPTYYTYGNGSGGAFLIGLTPNFALIDVDRVVSRSSHPFVELPVVFQYNFNKIGVKTGVNIRSFLQAYNTDNSATVDFLSNRLDIGLLSGISFRLSKKLTISADYCFGITKLTKSIYTFGSPPTDLNLTVSNRFAQLSFEYSLGK